MKEENELSRRLERLAEEMKNRFGGGGEIRFFRAPGRVDLMGSHTDYNQGFILAATVDRDLLAAARAGERGFRFYSLNTGEEVRVPGSELVFSREDGWANYPKGVIKELRERGIRLSGLDLLVDGNIPVGGNLSSSAALEAVTCEAVLGVAGADLPPWEKVKLCKRAENDFMGLPCGIMDQFTVIMGGEGRALLLDCRSLEFEPIPFASGQAALAVIDSGLGRALVAGKYADRVRECEAAVKILAAENPRISSLRDAGLPHLERNRDRLGELLYRRARHVVSENGRVSAAAAALKDGDLPRLGRIMEEGYQSSRNDYENSIPELDILHDLTAAEAGVLGVRICGAGWGGCLLALVTKEQASGLEISLAGPYLEKTGRRLRVWIVTPSPGAGPLARA